MPSTTQQTAASVITLNTIPMSRITTVARNLAVLSYFTLLALMVATTFLSDIPEDASKAVIVTVKLLPLLLFLPGILQNKTRSHIWLCFVVLLYFTQYSMLSYLHEWAIVPVITTLVTMSVFISSMMFVHWYKKDQIAAITLSTKTPEQ